MLEELCRDALLKRSNSVKDDRLGKLLHSGKWCRSSCNAEDSKYERFFGKNDEYTKTLVHELPIDVFNRKRRGDADWLAWIWFNEKSERIIDGFFTINGTNAEKAINDALEHGITFATLFDEFKSFFKERKRIYMNDTNKALESAQGALRARGKTPQSHGGVANLLKVLTKTMHDQGSSVLTIAKVQYAVCMQAGIMIPSEFLTDVLVAQEIIDEGSRTK